MICKDILFAVIYIINNFLFYVFNYIIYLSYVVLSQPCKKCQKWC